MPILETISVAKFWAEIDSQSLFGQNPIVDDSHGNHDGCIAHKPTNEQGYSRIRICLGAISMDWGRVEWD